MSLGVEFYARPALQVARELLGKVLVHETAHGKLAGRIVETEAYLPDDPASHSFHGPNERNAPMFERPGLAYVYKIYGLYHCFNIVTGKARPGEAVLIRALQPLAGIEWMRRNRGINEVRKLCNGPAKLVIAMEIHPNLNGTAIIQPPLYVKNPLQNEPFSIGVSTRIGINKARDLPYRFYIMNNEFVSNRLGIK